MNVWHSIIESHPAGSSTPGASITPGASNTFGSYATVLAGASVLDDAFFLEIRICGGAVSAAARDHLVTIGFDPAGGTSFGDKISNLVCGPASAFSTGDFGTVYRFPLRVKAGTSIGAKASVNNATAGTIRVSVTLYGKPSHPELVQSGSYVRTYGANTATSAGTAITEGASGAEGAWTELGTSADPIWWLQLGAGHNNATSNNNAVFADIGVGDASNKVPVALGVAIGRTTGEAQSVEKHDGPCSCPSGTKIYGRMSSGGSAMSGGSMAAYGVGG